MTEPSTAARDIVDPRWGRIMETAGESPTVVSEFGKAFVEGIAGNGTTLIAAPAPKQCAKAEINPTVRRMC